MNAHPLTKWRQQNEVTLDQLAQKLGVQRAAVWKWERKRVPAERMFDVERVTGIPCAQLRPDLHERERQ